MQNEQRHTFWTKFENNSHSFMPLHWTMKKYSIQSPCLHNLISTKKFIHKHAYIPDFLFAISLKKSLKSVSSRTNNDYVFIFQATKQDFERLPAP